MCRAPSPNRAGSLSASTAARTRSRLSSGSPMPMNTMFVSRWPSAARRRAAWRTWSTISAVVEVAGEAELAGRAERAADGAAGLARDAQRVPLAAAGPGRVVHQHATRRARRRRADGGPSRSGRRRRSGSRCRRPCRSGTPSPRAARSGRRQRRDRRRVVDAAARQTASRDLAGAVRGLATCRRTTRAARRGVRPDRPGPVVGTSRGRC